MGKKWGLFSVVKKALSPQSKKDQKTKSAKKRDEENKILEANPPTEQPSDVFPPADPQPIHVVTKSTDVDADDEQNKHAYSVVIATTAAAEAAIAAAQAAAEVVRLTTVTRFDGKTKEEIAVIKIQTAFRGYLARRALRALRGLVKLKTLIDGPSVKRQAATALRCMQTLGRVQSQIRSRRIRMSEENQALQRQLQLKHEKELEKLRMGEIWDDSTQSKDQIEASLQSKQVAAMRRERALAYAFTHQQQRKNNKNSNPTFMDPNNPQWGWSWMERWMASRPWESRSMADKETADNGSVKSFRTVSVAGEINRAYALRDLGIDSHRPSPTGQRPTLPPVRARPESPKTNGVAQDEDTMSAQSDMSRRHSIAGGQSIRDDESLASSPSVPSYMAPTKSAKARIKQPSPLGVSPPDQKPAFVGTGKKRMSFSASPRVVPRRHSVPGKFESTPVKDIPVQIFVSH